MGPIHKGKCECKCKYKNESTVFTTARYSQRDSWQVSALYRCGDLHNECGDLHTCNSHLMAAFRVVSLESVCSPTTTTFGSI